MFRGIDLALLKFCLEADDGPAPGTKSNLPQRDPKDYEWLRAALNNLEGASNRLKKCIAILKESNHAGTKVAALEELQFYVEDLDLANDLAKMGLGELSEAVRFNMADAPVLEDTSSATTAAAAATTSEQDQSTTTVDESGEDAKPVPDAKVRETACWVLSTMAQNNPFCQKELVQQGLFQAVMWLLLRESDSQVIAKALGVVSAVIRDFPAAQQLLLAELDDVFLLLGRLLLEKTASVRTKSIVLLNRLCDIFGEPVVRRVIALQQRGETSTRPILHAILTSVRRDNDGDAIESEQALHLLQSLLDKHASAVPENVQQLVVAVLRKRLASWPAATTPSTDDDDADEFHVERELVTSICASR